MAYYYIKLYHEVLDDIKMGPLSDHLWRRCVELFLLAGVMGKDGKLPQLNKMAWKLRVDIPTLVDELISLQEVGILSKNGDTWTVTNFEKRQAPDTPAERMRHYREHKRKENEIVTKRNNKVTEERYENVTFGVQESESESESYIDDEEEEKTATPNIFRTYEREFGPLTPAISEKLKSAEEDYPPAWVDEAIKIGSVNNARSLAYVEAILRGWKEHGYGWKPGKNGKGDRQKKPASHDAIEEYLKNLEDKPNGN